MKSHGKRFLISGRVQGVFYRGFAQREAVALALTGWARNLADGRVEVEAFGGEQALQHYKDRLRRGPRAARVDEVQEQVIEYQEHATFEIIM